VADEFREVIMKEIRSFMVQEQEKWHPRDRRIADYEPRIAVLEEHITIFQPQINPLYEILEAFTKSYAQAGREWLAEANKLFEAAKVNLPSEAKPSRRQLRKKQAQQTAEAQQANGIRSADHADDDQVDEDLIQ
jgi:hypothetical protein